MRIIYEAYKMTSIGAIMEMLVFNKYWCRLFSRESPEFDGNIDGVPNTSKSFYKVVSLWGSR